MYERILLPLDGSRVGEAALPYVEELVAKLAPATKVEVTLLQVVSPLSHFIIAGEASAQIPFTEKELEQVRRQAAAYLEKAAAGLTRKGAMVKARVAVGTPAEEIIKAADEIDASLIAMSTHGRSGIGRWAFGSVTDRVLRFGNKPVLMVRAQKESQKASSR